MRRYNIIINNKNINNDNNDKNKIIIGSLARTEALLVSTVA